MPRDGARRLFTVVIAAALHALVLTRAFAPPEHVVARPTAARAEDPPWVLMILPPAPEPPVEDRVQPRPAPARVTPDPPQRSGSRRSHPTAPWPGWTRCGRHPRWLSRRRAMRSRACLVCPHAHRLAAGLRAHDRFHAGRVGRPTGLPRRLPARRPGLLQSVRLGRAVRACARRTPDHGKTRPTGTGRLSAPVNRCVGVQALCSRRLVWIETRPSPAMNKAQVSGSGTSATRRVTK